jgi:peptidase A4-like protein
MHIKNHATAWSAVAGLAAALLLTACSSGASSHPSARTTTSPAPDPAASAVTVSDQQDSNWAGYVVASSATTKASFSAVSGSWTQPPVDCQASYPSHAAFWVGLGGYSGEHLEQTGTSADCSASGQATYYAWYELVPAAEVLVNMTVRPGDRLSAHVAIAVPVIIKPGLPHPLTSRLRQRHVHRCERVRGRPDRLDHQRFRPGQRAQARGGPRLRPAVRHGGAGERGARRSFW